VPSYAEALKARTTTYIWPDFLGKDTDANENLAKLRIPGLWIFGGRDGSIPVDLSIHNLQKLRDAGHRYEHVLQPALGHNNMPETFDSVTAWIRKLPR
jgi:pimeloyl-ACP methyl ester carboxylesterase